MSALPRHQTPAPLLQRQTQNRGGRMSQLRRLLARRGGIGADPRREKSGRNGTSGHPFEYFQRGHSLSLPLADREPGTAVADRHPQVFLLTKICCRCDKDLYGGGAARELGNSAP